MTPRMRGQPCPRVSPLSCRICNTHSSCRCRMSACMMPDSSSSGDNSIACSFCQQIDWLINPLDRFFSASMTMWHYPTLAIDPRIPGLSACPHRWFYTLPGLLHSRVALPNPYHKFCVPSREAVKVCTIFMMVLGTIRTGREPTAWEVDRLTT